MPEVRRELARGGSDAVIAGLEDCYSQCIFDYANKDVLKVLFRCWLMDYKVARNMQCPYLRGNIAPHDSAVNPGLQRAEGPQRPRLLSRVLFGIFAKLPQLELIIPGGASSSFESFKLNVLRFWLSRISFDVDDELRISFVTLVLSKFDDDFTRSVVGDVPRDFFMREKKSLVFAKSIRGAPLSLQSSLWIKLLFFRSRFKILGVSHGALYGELQRNELEDCEVEISDQYFFWGFGDANIRQNRFAIKSSCLKQPAYHLMWMGGVMVNDFIRFRTPDYAEIISSADKFLNELSVENERVAMPTYLPHPSYPCPTPSGLQEKKFRYLSDEEKTAALFIIDRPGMTFLYQAIYQELRFVVITDTEWSVFLSSKYIQFLEFLRTLGVVFSHDEFAKALESGVKGVERGIDFQDVFSQSREWLESDSVKTFGCKRLSVSSLW